MNACLAQYPDVEGNDPFTPERLYAIAARWDEVIEEIAEGKAPPSVTMSLAHFRAEQARGIAAFMEREGIASRRNIGCFQLDFVKKGDVVRIKKGVILGSMHPQDRKNGHKKVNGVTRTVTVHRHDHGFTDNLHKNHKMVVVTPRIVWPGAGGYWMYADLNDVEIVSRAA